VSDQPTAWVVVEHPDGHREHVRLTLALTTIGRSEQNVVELLDPKLSRFHCEIERRGRDYYLRDCNSRNGTEVNGERAIGPTRLADGDVVTLGRSAITYHRTRPDELGGDERVVIHPPSETGGEATVEATPEARKRETRSFDPRRTVTLSEVAPIIRGGPWRALAEHSQRVLDAATRPEVLEEAARGGVALLQGRGVLISLGSDPDVPSVAFADGLDVDGQDRCLELVSRVLAKRGVVVQDRRGVGLPLFSRESLMGALVVHDLPREVVEKAEEVEAAAKFANLVGRSLSGSYLIEEVRRDERAAGARRVAHDLRYWLRPEGLPEVAGLDLAVVAAASDDVGRDFWDCLRGPPRAGREEVYVALGDVPDGGAPPRTGLRRRGERSLLSLLGQAEVRGALRSLVEALPRTAEILVEVDKALRRQAVVDRAALALLRYDPEGGALRLAGAGHEPVLVRRADGAIEAVAATAPPLGTAESPPIDERDLRWGPGDEVVLVTSAGGEAARRHHGEEGLTHVLAKAPTGGTAHALASGVVDELLRQAGSTEVEGLTVVALRRV